MSECKRASEETQNKEGLRSGLNLAQTQDPRLGLVGGLVVPTMQQQAYKTGREGGFICLLGGSSRSLSTARQPSCVFLHVSAEPSYEVAGSLGSRLEEWLKRAFGSEKKPLKQVELAKTLGVSTKTVRRLSTDPNALTLDMLTRIRGLASAKPNSEYGMFLIDEMIARKQQALIGGATIEQKVTADDAILLDLLENLSHGDGTNDETLGRVGAHLESLYRRGTIEKTLSTAQYAWHGLQPYRHRLGPGLVTFGTLYARLLATQNRYDESTFVSRTCSGIAARDGSLKEAAFAYHAFLAARHRQEAFTDPSALHADVKNGYLASIERLEHLHRSATKAVASHVRWPLNHAYRTLGIYTTRLVGPRELDPARTDLLRKCERGVVETARYVDEDPKYCAANDIVITAFNAALKNPRDALDETEHLRDITKDVWDQVLLDFVEVLSLRRIDTPYTRDKAVEVLRTTDVRVRRQKNAALAFSVGYVRNVLENQGTTSTFLSDWP